MKTPKHLRLFALSLPLLLFGSSTQGQNLLLNGNFELGNTLFSSDYTFAPAGNSTEGEYTVRSDPQNWNGEFAPTPDHTSGAGMMLVVNGATAGNLAVWEQTVQVNPFMTYQFNAWVSTAVAGGPANLGLLINNVPIGSTMTAPDSPGTWLLFDRAWSSGSASTATIRLLDTDTSRFPNDFYLDDMSFAVVPEPSTWTMLGLGVVGFWLTRKTKRNATMRYSEPGHHAPVAILASSGPGR